VLTLAAGGSSWVATQGLPPVAVYGLTLSFSRRKHYWVSLDETQTSIFEAIEAIGAVAPIVLLSPRGCQLTHSHAVRYSEGSELTLLCGHYKDVDQRVAEHLATEEVSLGDFVLSGGEPAALVVIDATVRLLPGAMSDLDSARGDSFFDRGISAPSYTRPPEFRGYEVPEVLLSGDHAKIAEWRRAESERLTAGRGGAQSSRE